MSDIGYQNSNQARLTVSANSLEAYIRDLEHAVRTPNESYEEIGVKVDGVYRQLNPNHLQIENEYYSAVRPKRVARSGEKPSEALRRGGIEYVELRSLDISPFDPVGINRVQIRFLEVFLVYCLLKDSPPISIDEKRDNSRNHALAAGRGRDPELELRRGGRARGLRDWGLDVCREMLAVAELLDSGKEKVHTDAVEQQIAALENPDLTPSAKFIGELADNQQSVFEYAMELSRRYAEYFQALPTDMNAHQNMLFDESRDSLRRQAEVEAADTVSFDAYLEQYFS
jgi:glutamate--cysteine ligase